MQTTKDMTIEQRRAAIRQTRANHEALEAAYNETRDGQPLDTIAHLTAAIGYDAAMQTIAEAVNGISDWDARVSVSAHQWALNVPGAAGPDEISERCYYVRIHAAHLRQLADAAMQFSDVAEAMQRAGKAIA